MIRLLSSVGLPVAFVLVLSTGCGSDSGGGAPAPTIGSILPDSGPSAGGTAVTVTGTNYVDGATVSFGGTAATDVVFQSVTVIECVTPPGSGSADVVVTNPDGTSATSTGGFTYIPIPTIASCSPDSGPEAGATSVTITGTEFVDGAIVDFGASAATGVTVQSATSIVCTTPAGTGTVDVIVTNPDSQTATLTAGFTYVPPPTVAACSPVSGPEAGAMSVTISGTGFVGGATVLFGANAATVTTVQSATSIACATPSGTGTVDVVVTNPDSQSATLSDGFTYVPAPAVVGCSPDNGPETGSTTVTVFGTDFVDGATVRFGASAATGVTFQSATSIQCVTPAGSGIVDVTVTNPDTQLGTLAAGYTYDAPPAITTCSPNNGPESGSTSVTISGTDFVNGATVTFGGAAATGITFLSATSIECVTPAGSGSVDVVVTNPDAQSATLAGGFTYDPPPTVAGCSPGHGPEPGATSVSITGTDFVDGATVTFGGAAATGVTVQSATTIECVTPAGSATVDVVVTNPDAQSATLPGGFTYDPPPGVAGCNPDNGPQAGATSVTIAGTDFVDGATVTFGGNAATGVTFQSATSIECVTPAGASTVDVVVTNPDAQSGTLSGGFTYNPAPEPWTCSPTSGPEVGATSVVIDGMAFVAGPALDVEFGAGNGATDVALVDSGTITCTTPPGTGVVDVIVTSGDGQAATMPAEFTYVPAPEVTDCAPSSCPEAGGVSVTIGGEHFVTGATVNFGAVSATDVSVQSAATIECTVPAGTGVVDVLVTNPDGQSGTLISGFTYNPAPTITSLDPDNVPEDGAVFVQVNGTGFLDGASLDVTFGGVPAGSIVYVSPSLITCSAPAGTGTVDVAVTSGDGQSTTATAAFTYNPPPTVTGCSPNAGGQAGSTAVTITGTNFLAGAEVYFDGAAASNVTVIGPDSITCTTPAGTGIVDVEIVNSDWQSASLPDGFTFYSIGVPGDYATIQAAIDAASDGDIVCVADGTYSGVGNRGLFVYEKAITVRSTNGPAACTIDCGGADRGFWILDDCVVEGFTITNGSATNGGGIVAAPDYNITIRNCILTGNVATTGNGGGISCGSIAAATGPTIVDCVVSGNQAPHGAGIGAVEADIINCTVTGNVATSGGSGGINVFDNTTVTGCTISNNTAATVGGGVGCSTGSILTDCIIEGNEAPEGAGAYCDSSCDIISCTIANNNGTDGGGVFCDSGLGRMTNCIVTNNAGGGLRCYYNSIYLWDCTVVNNTSYGVSLDYYGQLWSYNSTIWGNSPGQFVLTDHSSVHAEFSCYADSIADMDLDPTSDFYPSDCVTEDPGIDPDYPEFVDPGIPGLVSSGGAIGDYHTPATSPCVDNGSNDLVPAGTTDDFDGEPRIRGGTVDIGAYEYQTANARPTVTIETATDTTDNGTASFTYSGTDSDGTIVGFWVWIDDDEPVFTDLTSWTGPAVTLGIHRFEVRSEDDQGGVSFVERHTFIYDASPSTRSVPSEYETIQQAIDFAEAGQAVVVSDGTYSGPGNRDLELHGKAITVSSQNGPAACTIDCEFAGRGFYLNAGEVPTSVVDGFTIVHGIGGGMYVGASPTISNCVITSCSDGPGMMCEGPNTTITGCTVVDNDDGRGIHIDLDGTGTMVVSDCTISGHHVTVSGGGVYARARGTCNISISGCTITDNWIDNTDATEINSFLYGGGIVVAALDSATITLADTTVAGNVAEWGMAGGIHAYCDETAAVGVRNCSVEDNLCLVTDWIVYLATYRGGGIYCSGPTAGAVEITNCLVTNNVLTGARIVRGGGIACAGVSCSMANCTIVNNDQQGSVGTGVGVVDSSNVVMSNTIVWSNGQAGDHSIFVDDSSSLTLHSCCYADGLDDIYVQPGGVFSADAGCLAVDPAASPDYPEFVDPGAPGTIAGGGSFGDLHLQATSPCIDGGDDAQIPAGTTTDLDGNPRVSGSAVDIGVYEFQ